MLLKNKGIEENFSSLAGIEQVFLDHNIFVGSKIGEKSFPEAVIAGFFDVMAMTIHELASKMKLQGSGLDHPAMLSSLKLLHA